MRDRRRFFYLRPFSFATATLWSLLLSVCLAVSAANAAPPSAGKDPARAFRDKWALIVGIGKFQSKDIPGLKYAVKDAKDFRDYLIKEANFAPDHVRILLDEDASRRRVLSELGNKYLARVAKPDDLVVLYFSGHGSPKQADIRGKNFVVAYDSDPEDLFTTGIEMNSILDSVSSRILSERVLLVLDACHSGSIVANAKGLARAGNFDPEELAQGSGQLVLSSSAPDQNSWESKRYQNGVFTRKLLEGLRMNGRKTTLSDAFPFVEKSVSAEVQEDYAVRQTPVLKSQWNGNALMLAAAPAEPQALPVTVKEILEPDSLQKPPATTAALSVVTASPAMPTVPTVQHPPTAAKSESVASIVSKGMVLFNRGDYASAADLLEKCVRTGGGANPDVRYYLANSFLKLNRTSDALREYRECFRLNPVGKRADYCLQVIDYYSRAYNPGKVNMVTAQAITPKNTSASPSLAGSGSNSVETVPAGELARIRGTLPSIRLSRRERPSLSEIVNWSRGERASYEGEAGDRLDRARTILKDGEDMYRRAQSMTYSLIPTAKNYGESEEAFAVRKTASRSAAEDMLQPYRTELDTRSKIVAEEESILSSCQSAARESCPGYAPYAGTTTGSTCSSTSVKKSYSTCR